MFIKIEKVNKNNLKIKEDEKNARGKEIWQQTILLKYEFYLFGVTKEIQKLKNLLKIDFFFLKDFLKTRKTKIKEWIIWTL